MTSKVTNKALTSGTVVHISYSDNKNISNDGSRHTIPSIVSTQISHVSATSATSLTYQQQNSVMLNSSNNNQILNNSLNLLPTTSITTQWKACNISLSKTHKSSSSLLETTPKTCATYFPLSPVRYIESKSNHTDSVMISNKAVTSCNKRSPQVT